MALITVYYNLSYGEYTTNDKWKNYITTFHTWCSENCTGYYCLDLSGMTIRCDFEKIEEAMAFKLRWF